VSDEELSQLQQGLDAPHPELEGLDAVQPEDVRVQLRMAERMLQGRACGHCCGPDAQEPSIRAEVQHTPHQCQPQQEYKQAE